MAKKKPVFSVMYYTSLGSAIQAVKAVDEVEAKQKFCKRFPKISDDSISDIEILDQTSGIYKLLIASAI